MIAPGGTVPAVPAPLLSKKNTGSEDGNGLHDTQSTGFNVVIAQEPRTPQPKTLQAWHTAQTARATYAWIVVAGARLGATLATHLEHDSCIGTSTQVRRAIHISGRVTNQSAHRILPVRALEVMQYGVTSGRTDFENCCAEIETTSEAGAIHIAVGIAEHGPNRSARCERSCETVNTFHAACADPE